MSTTTQSSSFQRNYVEVPGELFEAIALSTLGIRPNGLTVAIARCLVWPGYTKAGRRKCDVQFEFRHPQEGPSGETRTYSFKHMYLGPKDTESEFWLQDSFSKKIHQQTVLVHFDLKDIRATASQKDDRVFCEVELDNQVLVTPNGTDWIVDLATGVGDPVEEDEGETTAPASSETPAAVDPDDAFLPD